MTIGAAGRILATVHNLVIGLIKRGGHINAAKARRYYEGHLDEAFRLTDHCKLPFLKKPCPGWRLVALFPILCYNQPARHNLERCQSG